MTKGNFTYKQIDCVDLCYQEYLIEKCNCYDVIYDRINSTTPCVDFTHLECLTGVYNKFYEKRIFSDCIHTECPLECESFQFTPHTSTAEYPSKHYAKILQANTKIFGKYGINAADYTTLKSNVLAITIFYDFLGYRLIKDEIKMTWIDLISNIGGRNSNFLSQIFSNKVINNMFSI